MTSPSKIPFERLRSVLLPLERIAIALSGGLDSSVLLAASADILGADRCLALTAETPYVMQEELRDSTALCLRLGVRQERLAFPILPALANNPPLRCYLASTPCFLPGSQAAEMGFPPGGRFQSRRPGRLPARPQSFAGARHSESLSGSCHGQGGYPPAGFRLGLGISLRQTGLCVSADRLEHNRPGEFC
ncbi:MAG: hypothetical protein ACLSUW_00255 [Akkermansia sp.]